jgi:hypothetical protein
MRPSPAVTSGGKREFADAERLLGKQSVLFLALSYSMMSIFLL